MGDLRGVGRLLIVPSLDLRGGRVVGLYRGRFDRVTVYAPDPVAEARRWVAAGARRLHLVDLDGAERGYPVQLDLVAEVARAAGVPVEVGGGLREEAHVEAVLAAGARWAVLGTRAVLDPAWVERCLARWPGRVTVSLDLRRGRAGVEGWREWVAVDPLALAERWGARGLADLIVTDAGRDGTMRGVDPGSWGAFLGGPWRLWVAGGVAGEEDLERLAPLAGRGLAGVIVGRALYQGSLPLEVLRRWWGR